MDRLQIRNMTAEDISAVHEIEVASFSVPWSREILEESFESENNKFLVAIFDGKLAGYINLWYVLDEATVANIAVAGAFRKQGIAAALMENALNEAEENGMSAVTLEVRVSNEPAIRLYEKFGFESVGLRPDYYEKPREAALIMWKYFH